MFLALSLIFLMKGLKMGEASRVLPIYNLSAVLSVVASILIFKEKQKIYQKILGIIICFFGLFLLGV